MRPFISLIIIALLLTACTLDIETSSGSPSSTTGETATVTRVVDGDTIKVQLNGREYSVRYIGINTPESDEACYSDATQANAALVEGKTVRLVKDVSETDKYDRLLRYIYVGDVFVNAKLVEEGFAEVVSYPPDTKNYDYFKGLEEQAASANRGCHRTGIFDDGSYTR